jgi:glycosyltransferase involved in cell wall biosynthesis
VTAEPLVSVVVPVFNVATYLDECLQSIRGQIYTNWNCTIVDNASTDPTPDIARRFAALDSRFRHQRFNDFVSAIANHNRAFESVPAESEFCKVVQADDWLYETCLARMVEVASSHPSVGVVSAYQLWERRVHLQGLPYETTFCPGHDILRGTLRGEYHVTGGPTAHMLRSAFLRERRPFYEEGFRHTDTEAILWMLTRHDFAFVHEVLTFARDQADSRSRWSRELNSHAAEDIVFLLRYGRAVLEPKAYRERLRDRLRTYVSWHVRQVGHSSWLQSDEFFEFHREKCGQILAASNGDREVAAAMTAVRVLLARDSVRRFVHTNPS